MQTQAHVRRLFQNHRSVRTGLLSGSMLLVLLAVFLSSCYAPKAHAQSACSGNDQVYVVASGDNLSRIAARYNMSWQSLAAHNGISDPNQIYPGNSICIPGAGETQTSTTGTGAGGSFNPFPHGQCTWWADQRYFQLHGVYIPWMYGADAWQWTQRAYQYGWHVSKSPTVGAILDLQPWVQGAHGYGHVAVVERILGNGHVIASNMNWEPRPWAVTDIEFIPGPGVTFITN